MTDDLTGKVVIVTGGAYGLGRSHVEALAGRGAHVGIVDLDGERAAQVAADLPSAIARAADVTDAQQIRDAVEAVAAHFGGLDALVTSAGGPRPNSAGLDCSEADWRATLDLNLSGCWLAVAAAIPHLTARGGGRIVATTSDTAHRPVPGIPIPYVAAKAGVIGLVRALALATGPHLITANAVAPGFTPHDDMLRQLDPAAIDEMANAAQQLQSLTRRGTPGDVTAAVLFLISDAASFITGQVITVDGGLAWS